MAEIEIEGKTVEEAIEQGLAELGLPRDKAEVKILDEGANGLFGLMGNKPARVRVSSKSADGDADPAADYAGAQKKVREIIAGILNGMNVGFTEITTSLMAGRILVDIKSPESSILIGKNGQTLDALDNITNLMLHRDEAFRVKVCVDAEGYHKRQEERLQELAKKAAEQVTRTGKPYRFEPMSSRERRVIHLILKSDSALETFSEGEGAYRKVVISLKK